MIIGYDKNKLPLRLGDTVSVFMDGGLGGCYLQEGVISYNMRSYSYEIKSKGTCVDMCYPSVISITKIASKVSDGSFNFGEDVFGD